MALTGLMLGNGTQSTSSGGSSGYTSSNNTGYSVGGTFGSGASASALSHQMMEEANAFNREEAEKTRKFNAEQAEINRRWQENMSNTAYQRAMKDLKKAGLNPILAYAQGGAGVGSGAQAVGTAANSAMGQAYTDSYNESHNEGESYGQNSSWENSYMTSDLGNQIGAITGLVGNLIEKIKGNETAQAVANTAKEIVTYDLTPKSEKQKMKHAEEIASKWTIGGGKKK